MHTFHQGSASLHFTSLHSCFSLPSTLRLFIITLKFPHFTSLYFTSLHFTYNYFLNPLFKNMLSTGEGRQRLWRRLVPQFDCPIYKGIFTDIYYLFPGPNFLIMILRALVYGSCNLSLTAVTCPLRVVTMMTMWMVMVIHQVILLKNDLDVRKFQSNTKNVRLNILVLQKAHNFNRTPMIV